MLFGKILIQKFKNQAIEGQLMIETAIVQYELLEKNWENNYAAEEKSLPTLITLNINSK